MTGAGRLFFVIYVAGHVGGSVGPLPYDMRECLRRRMMQVTDVENAQKWTFIHNGIRRNGPDGREVRLMCERWTAPPPMEREGDTRSNP